MDFSMWAAIASDPSCKCLGFIMQETWLSFKEFIMSISISYFLGYVLISLLIPSTLVMEIWQLYLGQNVQY
jgi:hypothetical protein